MANVQRLEPIEDLYSQLQEIKAILEKSYPEEMSEELIADSKSREADISPAPGPSQELLVIWDAVLNTVRKKHPAFAARINNAIPVRLTQDEFTVGFHQDAQFSRKSLEDPKNSAILVAVLKEHLGRTVRITTTTHSAAVSIETMRKKLDQQVASIPRPEVRPQEAGVHASAEQRSRGKGNWQKRSRGPKQYIPPVQVTVQDIVKMFDGEIED